MGKIRAHAFERRLRRGEPISIGSRKRRRSCGLQLLVAQGLTY